VIRIYQAEHGGTASVQEQRQTRTRLVALSIIAAFAMSAAALMDFNDRTAALARADVPRGWSP